MNDVMKPTPTPESVLQKYTVIITEEIKYEVEVEAANDMEAELIAEDVLVNAENMDDYFMAVTDRYSFATEKEKTA